MMESGFTIPLTKIIEEFELEKIYVGAMDFAALDVMTEKLSQRLCTYFNV